MSGANRVEKNSGAPDVGGLCVGVAFDHFWGGVCGAATCGIELWADVAEHVTEAEVDDTDVVVTVEEDVFAFEIAVSDFFLDVEIFEDGDELGEVATRLVF